MSQRSDYNPPLTLFQVGQHLRQIAWKAKAAGHITAAAEILRLAVSIEPPPRDW